MRDEFTAAQGEQSSQPSLFFPSRRRTILPRVLLTSRAGTEP